MSQLGQQHQNGGQDANEQELATKVLQIQSKRFYLDVKQNSRGRFVKIAEVGGSGRRSRLTMSLSTAADFKAKLNDFIEIYSKLTPLHVSKEDGSNDVVASQNNRGTNNTGPDDCIHSDQMMRDNRRYYLDLKENARGRFLRVSMATPARRTQIAIPAQGMIEMRNAMVELLTEFGGSEAEALEEASSAQLPESKSMRVENKMFYFDVGNNRRGVFMRISEVRQNFRTAVTIPIRSWGKTRDIITEFMGQLNSSGDLVEEMDKLKINNKSDMELKNNTSPVAKVTVGASGEK